VSEIQPEERLVRLFGNDADLRDEFGVRARLAGRTIVCRDRGRRIEKLPDPEFASPMCDHDLCQERRQRKNSPNSELELTFIN
jgi:hypothetical protein